MQKSKNILSLEIMYSNNKTRKVTPLPSVIGGV